MTKLQKKKLITQGQFAVSNDPDEMITTLLGSCVACCLWDEVNGVGGMNHLLLAAKPGQGGFQYDSLGVAEMENLINGIIKLGGRRENLKAKAFGGASMIKVGAEVGRMNSEFVFSFLEREGIPCINADVGGNAARNLRFWPTTGRVAQRVTTQEEAAPIPAAKPAEQVGNDMELF